MNEQDPNSDSSDEREQPNDERLMAALRNLVAWLDGSQQPPPGRDPVLVVAMLLELHTGGVQFVEHRDFYWEVIPTELLERPLIDPELVAIEDSLTELFLSNPPGEGRQALLYAIGKGEGWMAYRSLARISREADLTEDEARQLVSTVARIMPFRLDQLDPADLVKLGRLAEEIKRHDIRPWLSERAAENAGAKHEAAAVMGIDLLLGAWAERTPHDE